MNGEHGTRRSNEEVEIGGGSSGAAASSGGEGGVGGGGRSSSGDGFRALDTGDDEDKRKGDKGEDDNDEFSEPGEDALVDDETTLAEVRRRLGEWGRGRLIDRSYSICLRLISVKSKTESGAVAWRIQIALVKIRTSWLIRQKIVHCRRVT